MKSICPNHDLFSKLSLIEKLHIDGIELEMNSKENPEKKKKNLTETFSSSSIKLSAIHLGFLGELQSTRFLQRRKAIEKTKQFLKVCAELGGIGVITIPSQFKRAKPGLTSRSAKKIKAKIAEVYGKLGEYAQDVGAYIILEPIDHTLVDFINTCSEAVDIIKMTGSDMVKICPDFHHMSIEEPAISSKIIEFASYIKHIHINDDGFEKTLSKLPGEGSLDFSSIINSLKEIKYQNCLSFDCGIPNEEKLLTSIELVKKLI